MAAAALDASPVPASPVAAEAEACEDGSTVGVSQAAPLCLTDELLEEEDVCRPLCAPQPIPAETLLEPGEEEQLRKEMAERRRQLKAQLLRSFGSRQPQASQCRQDAAKPSQLARKEKASPLRPALPEVGPHYSPPPVALRASQERSALEKEVPTTPEPRAMSSCLEGAAAMTPTKLPQPKGSSLLKRARGGKAFAGSDTEGEEEEDLWGHRSKRVLIGLPSPELLKLANKLERGYL